MDGNSPASEYVEWKGSEYWEKRLEEFLNNANNFPITSDTGEKAKYKNVGEWIDRVLKGYGVFSCLEEKSSFIHQVGNIFKEIRNVFLKNKIEFSDNILPIDVVKLLTREIKVAENSYCLFQIVTLYDCNVPYRYLLSLYKQTDVSFTPVVLQDYFALSLKQQKTLFSLIRSVLETEKHQNETSAKIEKMKGQLNNYEITIQELTKNAVSEKVWSDKKDAHSRNRFWGILGVVAFLTAFVRLYWLSYTDGVLSFDSTHIISDHITHSMFAFYVPRLFIIGFGLWILKWLVKWTLSEHHLVVNAGEKQYMMSAYMYLLNEELEKNIEPSQSITNDRSQLLASVFAPSSDGMIKDDAVIPVVSNLLNSSK